MKKETLTFSERLNGLRNDTISAINSIHQENKDDNGVLDLKDDKGNGAYIGIPDYDEYSDTPYLGTHEVTSLQLRGTMLVMVDECEEEFEVTDLNIDGLIGLYEHMETLYK